MNKKLDYHNNQMRKTQILIRNTVIKERELLKILERYVKLKNMF